MVLLAVLIGNLFAAVAGCGQDLGWSAVKRAVRAEYPAVPQLATDTLAARLAAGDAPLLLDVRTPEEFAVSHLAGARRVDPEAPDLAALDTLARATPIVVYCSVGYRSSALADRLIGAGFTNVSNLEGSIFQWANEGRPVYRDGERVERVHPYDRVWGKLLDPDRRAPFQ